MHTGLFGVIATLCDKFYLNTTENDDEICSAIYCESLDLYMTCDPGVLESMIDSLPKEYGIIIVSTYEGTGCGIILTKPQHDHFSRMLRDIWVLDYDENTKIWRPVEPRPVFIRRLPIFKKYDKFELMGDCLEEYTDSPSELSCLKYPDVPISEPSIRFWIRSNNKSKIIKACNLDDLYTKYLYQAMDHYLETKENILIKLEEFERVLELMATPRC